MLDVDPNNRPTAEKLCRDFKRLIENFKLGKKQSKE